MEEVLPTLLEQQVHVDILADRCKAAHMTSFRDKMRQASCEPIPRDLRSNLTLRSTAVYIYTSGTTGELRQLLNVVQYNNLKVTCGFVLAGLPKAAEVHHSKVWAMSMLMSAVGVTAKDVIYSTLPLYHSAGFLGCTSAIESGTLTFIGSQLKGKLSTSLMLLVYCCSEENTKMNC